MAKRATKGKRGGRGAGAGSAGTRHPIDAALELAAVQGWRHTGLSDIAGAAGLSLAELYLQYPSKGAILAGLMRRVDTAMLQPGPADATETAKDRLFEVIMRRLDALAPHKIAMRSILREAWCDPASMTPGAAVPAWHSLEWMLAAAGIETDGLRGLLRRKGLALIYLDTLRIWLADDSEDMARTMAALDRRLRQVDGLLRLCRGRRRRTAAAEAE